MWFFAAPTVVFGEDSLDYLDELQGDRALIVTDPVLDELGFSRRIGERLERAGMEVSLFAEVEPEPSIETVRRGVEKMNEVQPDWLVGLGGGSAMDAAKAIWALYERPDLEAEEISPANVLNLHKVRMIAIPTTSGTGSEATWIAMLTSRTDQRKIGVGNREIIPTIAIVDPQLSAQLPAQITADTGLDALTHAVEAYSTSFHNDFSDGLALKACELVFEYLPRAVKGGEADSEARERLANAATIAGIAFGNSYVGLAHALGHSLGATFHLPHGRVVSLFLPYVIEFTSQIGAGRYDDIVRSLGWTDEIASDGAACLLVQKIRMLQKEVGQPLTLKDLGIEESAFEEALETLVSLALTDSALLGAPRMADLEELEGLYRAAYHGRPVGF